MLPFEICHMKKGTYISAEEAVKLVKSGDRVFLHGSAATPIYIINALQQRYLELKDVELVSITSLGVCTYVMIWNNAYHDLNQFFKR